MPNPPIWSLSHWYMWLPLWLLICIPGFIIIGKIIVDLYKERRDRRLLMNGAISVNDYRRRRGITKYHD